MSEWQHEAEGYEPPSKIRINEIPHGNEPAAERCAEMVVREMRAPMTASRYYAAAARWFALAHREGR